MKVRTLVFQLAVVGMLPNNPDKTKHVKAADPPPSWMLIPQTRACSLPLTEIPHGLRRSSGRCRRPCREGHRRAADQERRLSAGRHLPRNKMAPPLFPRKPRRCDGKTQMQSRSRRPGQAGVGRGPSSHFLSGPISCVGARGIPNETNGER